MTLDLNAFTPASALAGGVLIGLAAAMFVLFNGRIAGISGILGGLLRPKSGDVSWRLAFVMGLVSAPLVYLVVSVTSTGFINYPVYNPRRYFPENISIDASEWALIAAGLLVGIGTRCGSGCTSGHGVCGLSRFSVRSLAATLLFMAAGFATVFVTRHLLGAA